MTTRLNRRLPLLLAAAVLAPALAACGTSAGPDGSRAVEPINVPPSSTPATPDETAPTDPETTPWPERIAMSSVDLVTVETSGGMCADGNGEGMQCGSVTTIAGDGSWKVTDEQGARTGRLGFEELTRLTGALYATDATSAPKDEISCASWVDGRDVTLTYASATGKDVTVSSCEYDLSGVKLLEVVSRLTA